MATRYGAVEYAEVGEGDALLAVHGIYGGRDAGLVSVGDLAPGRRVIAPSRFGYLGSSMPQGATPAMQADAFAELLDALGLDRVDVMGFSAGSTSVLQLALRHPDRIRRLIVVTGDWPGASSKARPAFVRPVMGSDLALWLVKTHAGPMLLRFVAGVPTTFTLDSADRAQAAQIIDSIFPVAQRAPGVVFDAFAGNADVHRYDLEAITVPTLIVHARDDTLASYEAAEAAAARIPGARFVSHDRGGHLLLGHGQDTADAIAAFLSSDSPAPHHGGQG